jgi:glyoxylase-like metal-dependent hydrolase (beta-lactamase superfamily II)
MSKKILNPLVVSAIALLPFMTACSSDSKTETKASESAQKEVAATETKDAGKDFQLKPKKVAEGIWCMFGALEGPTKENAGFMSNSCYIETKDSWVLWDVGATYKFAKQAYEAMSKIKKMPVSTVIVSHEHDDHWLGAGFYKEKFGAKFIGTKLIGEHFKPGHEAETRMYRILNPIDVEGTKIINVDEVYDNGTALEIGGVKMQYISVGQAHSEDDFILYLPEKKVLLAADVIMNGRITSNRDGSVIGQLEAINKVKSLEWDVLVPGHGYITDKTAADESTLYFTLLKERILEALDDDVDATEITEVVTLPEFKDKAMYDMLNSNNVSAAYTELEMAD